MKFKIEGEVPFTFINDFVKELVKRRDVNSISLIEFKRIDEERVKATYYYHEIPFRRIKNIKGYLIESES